MDEMMKRARAIIGAATPLNSDCGMLCSGACCRTDEDGNGGVYIFPGEDVCEFTWGGISEDTFGKILTCEEHCDREHRPFACRIFPLTPVRNAEGKWTVRMDARARKMCPLYRSVARGLSPEFTKAVILAVREISKTPEGNAFLIRWEELEKQYRLPF